MANGPLPYIAGHVGQPIGCFSAGKHAHRRTATDMAFEAVAARNLKPVALRIRPHFIAACRRLPLCFTG